MKAISLWQPWGTLVVLGAKKFETRSWSTTYRGPLAVHASKTFRPECRDLCWQEPFVSALGIAREGKVTSAWPLPLGCLLGVVELADRLPIVAPSPSRKAGRCVGLDDEGIVRVWEPATLLGRVECHVGQIQLNEHEAAFGDYRPGRFAWELRHPRRFAEPVPCRGAQGLFQVPDELVREALAR